MNKNEINILFKKFRKKEEIINITDYSNGCDQKVYLIETKNNKYILKKPIKEISKINNEEFCIELLSEKNLPIPKLIYKNNEFLIESYIEGEILNENQDLSLYRELGKYISIIHSVKMKGFDEFNEKGEGIYKSEGIRDWFSPENPSIINCPILKKFDIISLIKNNSYLLDSHTSVLLHGDLKNGNIIYYKNKISGIIDFGDAIAGPPEIDLAHYYIFTEDIKVWNSFIEGYNTKFNIRKMYFYVFALCLWLIYDNFINENDSKYKKFLESVEYLN